MARWKLVTALLAFAGLAAAQTQSYPPGGIGLTNLLLNGAILQWNDESGLNANEVITNYTSSVGSAHFLLLGATNMSQGIGSGNSPMLALGGSSHFALMNYPFESHNGYNSTSQLSVGSFTFNPAGKSTALSITSGAHGSVGNGADVAFTETDSADTMQFYTWWGGTVVARTAAAISGNFYVDAMVAGARTNLLTLSGTRLTIIPPTTVLGSASGTDGVKANQNLLLYDAATDNWAGLQADASGNVALNTGTSAGTRATPLIVNATGGVQMTNFTLSGGAQPACAAGNRGQFWYAPGAAGVQDTVAVCAKDAADAYAFRTIY